MEKNKSNVLYIIIFIIILVVVSAFFKNLKAHQKKEYLVVNNRILEAAKKCFLEEKCEGEILLKDLYEKEYLSVQVNPITKENMDENICIKYDNNEAKFC